MAPIRAAALRAFKAARAEGRDDTAAKAAGKAAAADCAERLSHETFLTSAEETAALLAFAAKMRE